MTPAKTLLLIKVFTYSLKTSTSYVIKSLFEKSIEQFITNNQKNSNNKKKTKTTLATEKNQMNRIHCFLAYTSKSWVPHLLCCIRHQTGAINIFWIYQILLATYNNKKDKKKNISFSLEIAIYFNC